MQATWLGSRGITGNVLAFITKSILLLYCCVCRVTLDPGVKAVLSLVAAANETAVLQLLDVRANGSTIARRQLLWSADAHAESLGAQPMRRLQQTNVTTNSTSNVTATTNNNATVVGTNSSSNPVVPLFDWVYLGDYAVEDVPDFVTLDVPPLPPKYTTNSGLGPDAGHPVEDRLANSSAVVNYRGKLQCVIVTFAMCGLRMSHTTSSRRPGRVAQVEPVAEAGCHHQDGVDPTVLLFDVL